MARWLTRLPRSPSAEPLAACIAGDALLSLAADTSSAVIFNSPATPILAGARGESPRKDDPSLAVDYECESDEMGDSGRLEQRISIEMRDAIDVLQSIYNRHERVVF